jgi:hypothetical protein
VNVGPSTAGPEPSGEVRRLLKGVGWGAAMVVLRPGGAGHMGEAGSGRKWR